jgi:intein/homing endonuclease
MSKLTKEEREELLNKPLLRNLYYPVKPDVDEVLIYEKNKLIEWVEQKKKEWQEEAIRNYLEGETEDALCLD